MGNHTSMSLLDEGMIKTILWCPHFIVTARIGVDDVQISEVSM